MNAMASSLDEIAIVVNDGVILKSEITNNVRALKNNSKLAYTNNLRQQIIDHLILNRIQLQLAQKSGFTIGDLQLEQTMLEHAQTLSKTKKKLPATQAKALLIQEAQKQGISFSTYREEFRKQIMIEMFQYRNMQNRIQISPQEIDNLVNILNKSGTNQTKYRLMHILIPHDEDIESAQETAKRITKKIKQGADFKSMAIQHSKANNALKGGDWGYLSLNELPILFADSIEGQQINQIIGPLQSDVGQHILKIVDIKDDQNNFIYEYNLKHILIKTSPILSDAQAKKMLIDFTKQARQSPKSFGELALKYSEDPLSASKHGDLGWHDLKKFDSNFEAAALTLTKGKISEPVQSVHGWHIIKLIDTRKYHGSLNYRQEKARQMIFQRKFHEELPLWLNEIRQLAFVRYMNEKK
jgi:peptidyl-prolyl cis-trans isomerase SurA